MTKLATTLVLPALLLAGCMTTADAGSGGVTRAQLVGTGWSLQALDGAPAASDKAGLQFREDRIGMTAGCNGLGGEWALEAGRLIGGPYMSTQMFCDGLMEQERALAALLAEKPQVAMQGDVLVLAGETHRAEFRPGPPPAD